MTRKQKYYKLDDVRVLGKQEKRSVTSRKNQERKTGEAIRAARTACGIEKNLKRPGGYTFNSPC